MNLFTIVGTINSVVEFVDGDGFERDLASLELRAALDALKKSRDAADCRGQMWSVVNHLETSEAALHLATTRNLFIKEATRSYSLGCNAGDLFKIRLLMAACYIYLDEMKLAKELVDRAEECYGLIRKNHSSAVAAIFCMASGLLFLDIYANQGREFLAPMDIDKKLKPAVEIFRVALEGCA